MNEIGAAGSGTIGRITTTPPSIGRRWRFWARPSDESPRSVSPTIYRYVLGETFFAFLIAFLFFFFIFFVNQLLLLAQEILTRQVPFHQVAMLILFSIPSVIAMSAPFASLVGTLMTIGRLSSDNEILVLLSSGLSFRNVFLPAITVGIVISLISFVANDILLPAGTLQFRALYRRILVSTPALEMASNSVIRFRDTVIVTGDVIGNSINNVLIMDRTGDGERRLIMANTAELRDDGRDGLSLDMTRAFIQSSREIVREDYDYAFASSVRYWVPQEDIIQTMTSISPREMSSVDVFREIQRQTVDLSVRINDRQNRVSTLGLALEENLREGPASAVWNRRNSQLAAFQREVQTLENMRRDRTLSLYRLEFNQKFSIPFGAFSFVFLAVALGLMAKKSGQAVGFIFGLIISVIYWALLLGGQTMGHRLGTSPFWSIWTPNILALSIGSVLAAIKVFK